jgi:uncharacterized membrane protein (DUF373 family)
VPDRELENHGLFEGAIHKAALQCSGPTEDVRITVRRRNLSDDVQLEDCGTRVAVGRRMSGPTRVDKLVRGFEIFTVCAAGLLLMAAVAVATVLMYSLFVSGIQNNLGSINSVGEVQSAVERVFAGVLLLLLGLELLETLKTYFSDYHVRIEVILIVAMIAVGRHIVQIDFEHMAPAALAGVAMLILALSISYYLVRTRPSGT